MSYVSVFGQSFDVGVYGSGYAALAAAWQLAAEGWRVLLFSHRNDLLWESGRAFAADAGQCAEPLWRRFVGELERRNLYRDGVIDCAGAEIVANAVMRAGGLHRFAQDRAAAATGKGGLRALLGAYAIEAVCEGGLVREFTVATKSGTRSLRAGFWIDASEEATLFRICCPRVAAHLRLPAYYEQRALMIDRGGSVPTWPQPPVPVAGADGVAAAATAHWEPRLWSAEQMLCLRSALPLGLQELAARAMALRDSLGAAATVSVAQLSPAALAVYAAGSFFAADARCTAGVLAGSKSTACHAGENAEHPGNLFAATPALGNSAVATLADRFSLGLRAADAVRIAGATGRTNVTGTTGTTSIAGTTGMAGTDSASDAPPCAPAAHPLSDEPPLSSAKLSLSSGEASLRADKTASAAGALRLALPRCERTTGVLVAGAGSAGAMATLAAQRMGAEVTVIDPAASAGGIGTGGMILGYFHGQPGGLFEYCDQLAAGLRDRLEGVPVGESRGRHHEAKKLAFEALLARGKTAFLSDTLAYAVQTTGGRVDAVYAATPTGTCRIAAATVIDATGDGDLAALAGAAATMGRPGDGLPLSYSQPCLRRLGAAGEVELRTTNFDAGWVDPADPEDLTRARLVGIAHYLRDAYTDSDHPLLIAPILGLRQSRQIVTEQTLTLDDLVSHRHFANAIGVVRSPLDTHSVDYEFESDELLFWLWGCKHFRGITWAQMPYGALVPRGFTNLWIACRAAGLSVEAAYGIRMIRDVQRMGEAAGYAAAAAARLGCAAMDVPQELWQQPLRQSGALGDCHAQDDWQTAPLEQLDGGKPAGFLWTLYRDKRQYAEAVAARLGSADAGVSWLAAVVLAMWADERAEPRLLAALAAKETGIDTPRAALGPHGQWIDVPNWFLAVNLLRLCGTAAALPPLCALAVGRDNPLNLRTSLGLTLARLAERLPQAERQAQGAAVAAALRSLLAEPLPETQVRPSRSIYRTLLNQPQKPLPQEPEWVDTREDHFWQLWLAVAKASAAWAVPPPAEAGAALADERALVRRALQPFVR